MYLALVSDSGTDKEKQEQNIDNNIQLSLVKFYSFHENLKTCLQLGLNNDCILNIIAKMQEIRRICNILKAYR